MMTSTNQFDDTQALAMLRDALAETQNSTYSFDTKAQTISVRYVFALGVIGQMSDMLGGTNASSPASFVIFWGIIILPTIFFGFVLYPTR